MHFSRFKQTVGMTIQSGLCCGSHLGPDIVVDANTQCNTSGVKTPTSVRSKFAGKLSRKFAFYLKIRRRCLRISLRKNSLNLATQKSNIHGLVSTQATIQKKDHSRKVLLLSGP